MKQVASEEKDPLQDKTQSVLNTLLDISRRVHSQRDLFSLIDLLTEETKRLLNADLVSIFLLDREKCELCSIIPQDNRKICFDARLGIAGAAAMKAETINVPDAYEHPWFYKEVDAQTGYRTRTILAVPIKNVREEVIGVFEAINKKKGRFSDEDSRLLETLASHAANAIETAQFIDELRKEERVSRERDYVPPAGAAGRFSTQNIIGMSQKVQAIVRLIDQIRDSSVDVLIEGESGTGKELAAKALHYNGPRAKGPFIDLNCAQLPENLVESELFGIEKGVATGVEHRIGKFEQAHEGTLFLDEIGDLSPAAQAKILRVLQERVLHRVGGRTAVSVKVRIIAATNQDLESAMKAGKFREDLYYRLRVIYIHMPPLREIPEDIPILANHFLAKYCESAGVERKQFTRAALQQLTRHSWPGNARQLENEVKRLIASVRSRSITENDLDPRVRASQPPSEATTGPTSRSLHAAVVELEKRRILEVLSECNGNKHKTASILGLSRQGLIKKMNRYGLA